MKKLGLTLVMAMMAVMLVAGGAWAIPYNTRPVFTSGNTLGSLQGVFDGIGSSIDVRTEQEGAAIFTNQSTGANATYVASLSWNATGFPFEFGIYEYQNISNTVALFIDDSDGTGVGSEDPGDYTTLNFDAVAGVVYSEYHDAGSVGSTVISQTSDWIDNFGFYFSWVDQNQNIYRYYSEDDLNNDIPAFLAYQGNGDVVTIGTQSNDDDNHWYVAMEGYGGNLDFNDIVVQMESIQPVPEPSTMALLGIGLLGLAFVGKRKLKVEE